MGYGKKAEFIVMYIMTTVVRLFAINKNIIIICVIEMQCNILYIMYLSIYDSSSSSELLLS